MIDINILVEFVKHNILLVVVALASGTMLIWPLLRRTTGGPWVSATQATQLINREDAVVLDVREQTEYAAGHILGARSVPLGELDRQSGVLEKLKSKPVILCCASGNRSASALRTLKGRGFERVFNLSGGYAGWQQAGLPVER